MTYSESDWVRILTRLAAANVTVWAPLFARYLQPSSFSAGQAEMAEFLGQVCHESRMLARLEENLNYSAPRLCEVWPGRFPTLASARPFEHNPRELAEKVYGRRMGNNLPGEGWLFRGRGLIQCTGRDNYRLVEDVTGLPVLSQPDLLTQPEVALRVSLAWWEKRVPDSALGDTERVTRAVNGGTAGLEDRQKLTQLARKVLQ